MTQDVTANQITRNKVPPRENRPADMTVIALLTSVGAKPSTDRQRTRRDKATAAFKTVVVVVAAGCFIVALLCQNVHSRW